MKNSLRSNGWRWCWQYAGVSRNAPWRADLGSGWGICSIGWPGLAARGWSGWIGRIGRTPLFGRDGKSMIPCNAASWLCVRSCAGALWDLSAHRPLPMCWPPPNPKPGGQAFEPSDAFSNGTVLWMPSGGCAVRRRRQTGQSRVGCPHAQTRRTGQSPS